MKIHFSMENCDSVDIFIQHGASGIRIAMDPADMTEPFQVQVCFYNH